MMGSPPDEDRRLDLEGPLHCLSVRTDLAIETFEVTLSEFDRFAKVTDRIMPADDRAQGRERLPAIGDRWEDARAYVRWLSEQTGER